MFARAVLPLGICAIGALSIALLVWAKPKPSPMPPPPAPSDIKVKVTLAQPGTHRLAVSTQGTVQPKRQINLVAQVSGQVVAVEQNFVAGGFFSAGQTLVRIDDRDYQNALLSAEAQLAAAQQALAEEKGRARQAQREWRDLGDTNANDLFLRKPQLASAKAQLEGARAAVAQAKLNLERTHIKLPFNGRVSSIAVDLGQYVSAGSTLARVYDSEVVEIRLPLTEQQAALVQLPLNQSNAQLEGPVTITGSVMGELHQWQGRITRADASLDTNSRMYYVIAEVNKPFETSPPLLPGLFVQAEIQGKDIDNLLHLPRSALYNRDKLVVVSEDSTALTIPVEVLRRTEEAIWVRGDIKAKQAITLEKQALIQGGKKVEAIEVANLPTETNAEFKQALESQQQTKQKD